MKAAKGRERKAKPRSMRSIASRMSVMSGEGALSVFARAKELEAQGRSIIHLELGEPDFHPGKSVIESAAKALADGKDRYCAVAGVPVLREEIAAYLARTRGIKVSPANVVMAPGCKIALFLAMMALLEPGDEVLYPDPGFPGYPFDRTRAGRRSRALYALGAQSFAAGPGRSRLQNHAAHADAAHEFAGQSDGTVYTDAIQSALAELAVKHDLWVLSDEIYARILYDGEYLSMLRYPGMAERTLIIDGFSKSFAMTGWRLGYTVAPPEVVPALAMLAVNTYTCVAEFTQYAAIDALRDRENNTAHMVGEFTGRREQFVRDLNRVPGFRCYPPEGAFYAWVNITGTGRSAEDLCRVLLEDAGVAAIPGAAFGPSGKEFIRFSFASSMATLEEAVERIVKVSTAWQGTEAVR